MSAKWFFISLAVFMFLALLAGAADKYLDFMEYRACIEYHDPSECE